MKDSVLGGKFDNFIHFGTIGDKELRKKIVTAIYYLLQNKIIDGFDLTNDNTDNFATAIKQILSHSTMRELCIKDPQLAEQITHEILDFINKTKKHLITSKNPFETERELLQKFKECKETNFLDVWKEISSYIKKVYKKNELDLSFYKQEFDKSLDPKNTDKNKLSFESLKEHFVEDWSKLLYQKQIKWELEQIEKERKKFCEELYRQIEELKKLQEALEPFVNQLGRLWDMRKGNWQRVNFDVLKKYAELLQRDKSLQELADMLGRMQQAEREYEEEIFANTRIKPEWKIEHASKSDLVGIHESDDLSSLIPSEITLLADETVQSIFFKKFAEKKLLTYQYQAKMLSYKEEQFQDKRQKEKEDKKGPFIICVDTSGSMHGTPEIVAKTLCFAILKMAVRDNRKCYLISFSTEIQTLELTDFKDSLDKMISFLSMSFYSGTDPTYAIQEALRMLTTNDFKKADVIMVSDFIMPELNKVVKEKISAAKENKTKFHSLIIGKIPNQQVLKEFDNNWVYDLSDPNRVLKLVRDLRQL